MKSKSIATRAICLILAFLTFAVAVLAASAASVPTVTRLGGADRYQTATRISAAGWEKADTVVLACASGFADALAGVPLAYALDAPILLLDGKTLNASTIAEVKRLVAGKIYILGGTASISADIEAQLKADGKEVTRVYGDTRFETAEKIADTMHDMGAIKSDTVFFAYGYNYPDALAVGSVAAINGSPILYAPANGGISEGAADCLKRLGAKNAVILGGTAAVGADVEGDIRSKGIAVERCGGSDRYQTGLNIAKKYINVFSGNAVCFATGKNYPDALAGGVFAAKNSAPVVLVDEKANIATINSFVNNLSPEKAYVFGGSAVLPDGLISQCVGGAQSTTTTTTTTTTTKPTNSTEADVHYIYPDTTVYWAGNSSKIFHRTIDCSSMNAPQSMTYARAIDKGFRPCQNCCANCVFPTDQPKQYGSGQYKVSKDIPAGEYVVYCDSNYPSYICISTDSDTSNVDNIVANNNFYGQLYVSIKQDQYFKVSRGYAIPAQSAPKAKVSNGKLADGMYKVGYDIPAGEYRVICTRDSIGYYAIYDTPMGNGEIVNNELFDETSYVTVSDGQYLLLSGAEMIVS